MSSELRVNKLTNTTGINTITFTTSDAEFSGNVSIAGTLTYVDLANIDAVGIITAQSDVSIADKIIHTGDTDTALRFPAANTFSVETGGGERFRIHSNGFMGVGTNSPAHNLHVNGTTPTFRLSHGSTNIFEIKSDTTTTAIRNTTNTALEFSTNDTARLTIANSGAATFTGQGAFAGDLRVGATAAFAGTPLEVEVTGSTAGAVGISLINSQDSNASATCVIRSYQENRAGGDIVFGRENASDWSAAAASADGFISLNPTLNGTATERVRIDSSGRLLVCTTASGYSTADNFTIYDSGDCGVTIRSGSSSAGSIYFADGTTEPAVYAGFIDYQHTSDTLRFGTGGGQTRMYIDSNGKVGIGVASPEDLLHLQSGSSGASSLAAAQLVLESSGSTNWIHFKNPNTQNAGLVWSDADATERAYIFYDNNVDKMYFKSDATSNNLVLDGGKVGIGVASPARKFSVVDSAGSMVHFGVASGHGGYLGSTIASQAFLSGGTYYNGSNWVASDSYAQYINMYHGTIRFATNTGLTSGNTFTPTERILIASTGALSVYAGSTDHPIRARSGAGSGTSTYLYLGYHSATSTTTGTAVYGVFTDGSVDGAANSYGGWSDVKLKENIVDANSQWNDIKNLRVRNFNLKEGITKTQIGLIAQEAETVSPGLVFDTPDRDDDGNDLGTTTKSLRYSVLYMKAIKALQEAMAKIETLEAKVSALESS